jgi:hypothetical protein
VNQLGLSALYLQGERVPTPTDLHAHNPAVLLACSTCPPGGRRKAQS